MGLKNQLLTGGGTLYGLWCHVHPHSFGDICWSATGDAHHISPQHHSQLRCDIPSGKLTVCY